MNYWKCKNKTDADVVSGGLDLSTEEMAFNMQKINDEINFLKKDDRKKRYGFKSYSC